MYSWEWSSRGRIVGGFLEALGLLQNLVGASLSEPHTSVTALQDACVCMSACGHIPKI